MTTLSYVISVTRETAFETWARVNLGNVAALPSGDDDSDGIANFVEFALGLSGNGSDWPPPWTPDLATVGPDRFLRLSVVKDLTVSGVTILVEATSDLNNPASWSSVGLIVETDSASQLIVRDFIPIDGAQARFMRVKITTP